MPRLEGEAYLQAVQDLLWPGVRMWIGHGVPVQDFFRRDGEFFVTMKDGTERKLLSSAEVKDGSYKTLFRGRMKDLGASEP